MIKLKLGFNPWYTTGKMFNSYI